MIIYDNISKIDNKHLVNLSNLSYTKILQLGHWQNGYVTFLSEKNHKWWLMDLEWRIVVEPRYKWLRIKDWEYCVFLNKNHSDNNLYSNNNYWILSIKDDKELIEAKFRRLDIINWRLFGSLQEPWNGIAPYYQEFSLKSGNELWKEVWNKYWKQVKGKNWSIKQLLVSNWLPITPNYTINLEDCSSWALYLIYKDM